MGSVYTFLLSEDELKVVTESVQWFFDKLMKEAKKSGGIDLSQYEGVQGVNPKVVKGVLDLLKEETKKTEIHTIICNEAQQVTVNLCASFAAAQAYFQTNKEQVPASEVLIDLALLRSAIAKMNAADPDMQAYDD